MEKVDGELEKKQERSPLSYFHSTEMENLTGIMERGEESDRKTGIRF
jgi:hypothetical protein